MYGMDVNPLVHSFHLQELERKAAMLRETKEQAAIETARRPRRAGLQLLKAMLFVFPARRDARTT